jgi:hypothetical protein
LNRGAWSRLSGRKMIHKLMKMLSRYCWAAWKALGSEKG